MSWYTVVEREPHIEISEFANAPIELTPKVLLSSNKPLCLSLESQFFIAPFAILDSTSRTVLPIGNLQALTLVQNELVPHFDRCYAFYSGDEPVTVNLSNLKASTQAHFEQLLAHNQLHSLVTDLYRKAAVQSQQVFNQPTTIYQIHSKKLGDCKTDGAETLSRLICETFLSVEGHFTVVPTGWTFGEHVLSSSYLSFLAMICNDIYLHVNQSDQTVTAISGHYRQ